MNKFTSKLNDLYAEVGSAWVSKNQFVFQEAKECGLALAGSIGGAVASKKAKKIPGDIDFVTRDVGAALRFISRLQDKLLQYPTYWQIQVNHKTKFCPKNADCHFRLHAPFWLPVCVFVLKDGTFRQWFTAEAYPIQFFGDIKEAASEMEERDGRVRPVNLDTDVEVDYDSEMAPDATPNPYASPQ